MSHWVRQKPGRSKSKSNADSFVWTDDEVELLLKVTIGKCLLGIMPGKVPRYSGSFSSTVSFASLHLGLFFARLSRGVGWIQHYDIIVFEKFRFKQRGHTKTRKRTIYLVYTHPTLPCPQIVYQIWGTLNSGVYWNGRWKTSLKNCPWPSMSAL